MQNNGLLDFVVHSPFLREFRLSLWDFLFILPPFPHGMGEAIVRLHEGCLMVYSSGFDKFKNTFPE